MKPTFLPTLIPFTKEAQAVLALSPESYDGYWARKSPWISQTGEVFDQRLDLGDPRPAQPLRATEWNGTNQYAWIPIDPVTEFPFTLFGWARVSVSGTSILAALAEQGTSLRYFSIFPQRSDTALRIQRRNTTEINNDITIPNYSGNWTSYCISFLSDTSASVYINGILVETLTGLTSVNVGSQFNRFVVSTFRDGSPTLFLNGRSMHCGFLRRAATLQDAQAFHATGEIPDAEVLLPLDGNSTTVAHNIGSSAAHWLDEPRRNFLRYTEDFTNAVWSKVNSVALGKRITANAGTHASYVEPAVTNTPAETLTATYIFEQTPGRHRYVWIADRGVSPISSATFDLDTATVIGHHASVTPSVEVLPNGSVRCSISYSRVTIGTSSPQFALAGSSHTADRPVLAFTGVEFLDAVAQFELGSVATPYQPVLRTGIDYPEATIVNGAAGMLYTGRDVPFSRQNKIGYSTRRNLLPFSEDFNLWNLASQVTPNTHYGPSGQLNADTINRPGNSSYSITNTFTLTPGQQYCWSIWCRSGTNNKLTLMVFNSGERPLVGAKLTGAGSVTVSGGLYAQISGLDSSWSRFQVTFTAGSASSGSHQFYIYPVTSAGGGNMESGTVVIAESMVNIGNAPADPYQRIGANPGASVLIPALLSDPTKSAATDPLTFSGEVPRNAQLEQANCFTFDGSDDRVAVDLSQWAGPELVVNGGFNTDTVWTKFGSWTISAGLANGGGTSNSNISQNIGLASGRTYLVTYSISNRTTGQVGVYFGGTVAATYRLILDGGNNITTTRVVTVPDGSNGQLYFQVTNSWDGSIDNVSVRELPTDPSLTGPEQVSNGEFVGNTTGWIATGIASMSHDPTNAAIIDITGIGGGISDNQVFSLTPGKMYQFDVVIKAGTFPGQLAAQIAGNNVLLINLSGNYVKHSGFFFAATADPALRIVRNTGDTGTVFIDSISVKEVGLIPHDGTSLLTYRSQGDGFTGTAGTAFNIRIGDVEHIPCSEGAGNKLHGTKLNQEYLVVNGQADNWGTKQNTYHYNTAEGYSDALSDDAKIATLFEYGEQGAVYDCSDRSTMFQDIAGTQPITASGQTVALHLDKSKGLVLGPELVTNGSFTTDTDWTKGTGWTISGGTASNTTPATASVLVQSSILTPGKWYRVSVDLISTNGLGVLSVYAGSTASPPAFPFLLDLTPVAGTKTGVFLASSGQTSLAIRKSFDFQGTIDNISVRELPGNHRYQPTLASRPQYIEDASGHYLLYDGDNDWMETNAVDFTGTDKMTVWWGGRKLSDAARGICIEFGNGGLPATTFFTLDAPNVGSQQRFAVSAGVSQVNALGASVNAPVSFVLTGVSDLASPETTLRRNGVIDATSSSNPGSSYGNHKLFFGSRGGVSLPFNGREYMTIIRGAATPTNMVQVVENIVADKVGLAEFHANPTPPTAEFDVRLPASQTNPGFDVLGNPLTNPPVVGLNGAESRINFSPVANSWPTGISIPGADIPTYEFDGNPGDIQLGINSEKREASFHLRND